MVFACLGLVFFKGVLLRRNNLNNVCTETPCLYISLNEIDRFTLKGCFNLADMNWKKLSITFFRVAIGWHFLYEGLAKLWMENWSAHPIENRVPFEVDGKNYLDHNKFHNNIFCLFPDRTVEFVQRAKVPVMGFNVLAAGAIKPEDGFNWAFKNGADFICVGMFDFQVVNNVNITNNILTNLEGRTRNWFG